LFEFADLPGQLDDLRTLGLVQVEHLVRTQISLLDKHSRGAQHGVAVEIGSDLIGLTVGGLVVGPGVTHQAHRAHVQERRLAMRAHPGRRGARNPQGVRDVGTVGREVLQTVAVAVGPRHPAAGGLDADADSVVLADEQQWHGHSLVGGVQRGVDGTHRGGVVRRRVTEAAHRDRVVGPRAGDPEFPGPGDRERDAHGPRQVRRDGRGLRNDVQVPATEHLVPSAGDGFLGRTDQTEQDVADGVAADHLRGPRQEEAAGTVVQQRRIGVPECGSDGCVALVARRADGVVALAL
jgi:hypothetical protein